MLAGMERKTRSQCLAQAAYERLSQKKLDERYRSVAREFPTLIHGCGLAQAVAFALAKGHRNYLSDLAEVLRQAGDEQLDSPEKLADTTRNASVTAYMRLSHDALTAADWLKRYVEALFESNGAK